MSEQPVAQHDPMTLDVRFDALRPVVREYAQNLRDQVILMLGKYGVKSYAEFRQHALEEPRRIPKEALDCLYHLLRELDYTVGTNELPDSWYTFSIRSGNNPYYEVERDNAEYGITPHKEMDYTVDLRKVLEADRASYEFAGMPDWCNAMPEHIRELQFSMAQRERIRKELADGAIPLIMPHRDAQQGNWLIAAKRFQPVYWEGGRPRVSAQARISDEITRRYAVPEELDRMFDDTPQTAYLLLAKPTLFPPAETVNLTVDEQKAFLRSLQQRDSQLHALSIVEYLSLQMIYGERVVEFIERRHGQSATSILPFDASSRSFRDNACTRFISSPKYEYLTSVLDRVIGVAGAEYSLTEQRIVLTTIEQSRYGQTGFRFAVRIVPGEKI